MISVFFRRSKKSFIGLLLLSLFSMVLPMSPLGSEIASASCSPTGLSVTFNYQGGTVPGLSSLRKSKTFQDCSGTFTFSIPTRTGYVFAGWLDATLDAGGSPVENLNIDSTTWTPNASQLDATDGYDWPFAVYATWNPIPHSVTYNFSGAEGNALAQTSDQVPGDKFLIGSKVTGSVLSLPIPTRTGYTFAGWQNSGTTYALGTQFTMGNSDVTFTALWSANTYNITFNGNGSTSGSVPNSLTYTSGNSPTSIGATHNPNSLALAGYTFGGWSRQDTTTPVTSYGSAADVTLFAIWTGATYSISYSLGSGVTGTTPTTQSNKRANSTITTPLVGDIAKTGYTLIGWSDGTSLTGVGAAYTVPSRNVIFTPVFTRNSVTISYDANGATSGTLPANQNYNLGTGPIALRGNTGNLIKTGYTFIGWQETPTATTGVNSSSYTPTTGVTLFARWEANGYLVLYDQATAGTQWSDWYQTGYTPITFRTPVKEGYDFAGFFTAKTGGVRLGNSSDGYATYAPSMSCNNYNPCYTVYAYARWTPKTYTISYNSNNATSGDVPGNQSYSSGSAKTTLSAKPESLIRTGYTFGGWATSSSGTLAVTSYGSTADQTFFAIWKPISYKVIFYGNGGSVTTSSLISSANSPIILPTPTRTGYRSEGWFTATAGGILVGQAGAQYVPTAAITLYPHWVRS